jgi:hypothetical protein
MEQMQAKIERLLSGALRDGRTDLETLPNGHVCGHVISPEFEGLTYEERRLRIRQILEKGLTQDEWPKVSLLLTYTPQEWAFAPEEA